jgi:AMIN domain
VSNEDFRRELGSVFDEMAGTPSAALPDRVRSSLAHVPERRGSYWIAGLAAAAIAAVVIGVLVVANPLNHPGNTIGPAVGSSPTPVASPVATPDSNLPPFVCTSSSIANSQGPAVVFIDALRTGTHPGYDRLTVEFMNGEPASIELRPQSGTNFTQGASGQTITLAGKNGVLVVIHGADLHTSYSGSTDIKTGYGSLLEIRQVEDFEGYVQLGLGVSGAACYRAFILTNPDRLVIDIQAGS